MKRNLVLALTSCLLLFTALEVVLRTTHLFNARLAWTEPDRKIGWRFTPGRQYWFSGENDHPIEGRINSMGWRDREHDMQKAPRTWRVAVIGDSFVEGFQVELDSTFVAIAERRLNEADTGGFELLNFGRSGMCQVEESIVLERDAMEWKPDAVLLLFTPQNDIADVSEPTASDPCRPFFRLEGDSLRLDSTFTQRRDFRMRESINAFKQRSALLSLVSERYNTARLVRGQSRVTSSSSGLARYLTLCSNEPDSVFYGNYSLCKLLIARMAQTCSARGIKFVLMSVPTVYEPDMLASVRAGTPSFDPEFFDHDLTRLANEKGFDFIPLTAAFMNRARGGVPLRWAHWNYRGHDLVAAQIAKALNATRQGS